MGLAIPTPTAIVVGVSRQKLTKNPAIFTLAGFLHTVSFGGFSFLKKNRIP
jgi:hypothetical protein